MNARDQGLADAREDERTRYFTSKREAAKRDSHREQEIRTHARNGVRERGDVVSQIDDTGFSSGTI